MESVIGERQLKGMSMKFSNLRKQEVEAKDEDGADRQRDLDSMKMQLDVYDCYDIYEQLDDFIFKENPKKFLSNQIEFNKTKYAAKGSVLEFFRKYHKLDELKRKGTLVNKTPSSNFVESVRAHRIVPNPIGLVKRDGDDNKVQLNHYRIGDNYVQSLTHSLKLSDHISEIHLSENRLTNKSVAPLIRTIKDNYKLCKKVTHLNLGYNKIGKESIDMLCILMDEKDCELISLNLEANALGDHLIIPLCNQIVKSIPNKIKYLNLSQNNLTDHSAFELANLVENCIYLDVLILHSNQFKNFGAAQIVSKLKNNPQIKVFDISWNLIGSNLLDTVPSREELLKSSKDQNKLFINAELGELQILMDLSNNPSGRKKLSPLRNSISLFAKELGEVFKEKSSELIHLDISHNNIGATDCAHIGEEIKDNHTILGIHCDGNEMTIDELGFINNVDKDNQMTTPVATSQIYYKIDNEHPLIKTNVFNVRKIRAKNNCWICEGWKETKFVYKPQFHDENISNMEVKLYLNFENYKPFETAFRTDHFICHRMCPPGELIFYYTVNGVPVENYGQITHKLKDVIVHTETTEDGEMKRFIITKVAKTFVDINPNVIEHSTYKKVIKFCEPRPERKVHKKVKPRTPWAFPLSIWAAYDYNFEGDSESYIEDVFENDFNRCQFIKEMKTPEALEQLRVILRGYFRQLVDCYRYYASVLAANIWQISKNSLLELVNSCPGLLNDTYNFNDVVLQSLSVINTAVDKEERTKNKNKNLPDNIVRHQFMSLLVKMAKDKYMSRNKTFEVLTDAVKAAFENNYMPVFKVYDIHKWRMERYYNEFTDNIIKAYLPIFDAVYRSWAAMKEPGRRDTWINLDEFNNVCIQIVDNEYPVREIPITYNHSIRLQVNEIESERHLRMFFPEFIEGFCRVMDRYSPVPADENPEEWTPQMRQEQHLSAKLETVMPRLIKLITHSDYRYLKEKFVIPGRDEETELLKYDMNSPPYQAVWPKIKKGRGYNALKTEPK